MTVKCQTTNVVGRAVQSSSDNQTPFVTNQDTLEFQQNPNLAIFSRGDDEGEKRKKTKKIKQSRS